MEEDNKDFLHEKIKLLETENEELRKLIKWMEGSIFWRIRNIIFKLLNDFFKLKATPGTSKRNFFYRLFKPKRNNSQDFINKKIYWEWLNTRSNKEKNLGPQLPTLLVVLLNNGSPILEKSVESIKNQGYLNMELLIVDNENSINFKKEFNNEVRIEASSWNRIFEGRKYDYVLLLDDSCILVENCFSEFVEHINNTINTDIIYSDNDNIDENSVVSCPEFKPGYSPDNLFERNYIGNLFFVRRGLIEKVLKNQIEKFNQYDFLLRLCELTDNIDRVPKVLFHKYIKITSSGVHSDLEIVNDALQRRNEKAKVVIKSNQLFNIEYLHRGTPKVSIIIPAKNNFRLTKACLKSVFQKSTYSNLEVILVDNGSDEKSFLDMASEFSQKFPVNFKWLKYDIPFNFSKLVNYGVKNSRGDYIILLNNDTEVITEDWIEKLLGQVQRPSIGVAGVKLLYPNDKVQHAGVALGINGLVGHPFVKFERYDPVYFNTILLTKNCSALTAACFMVEKRVFNKVNGFEESLAVDYNDVDFCLKVRELGLFNVYLPYVELYHYESISRGDSFKDEVSIKRHIEEVHYLKSRWENIVSNDPFFNPNLLEFTNSF